MPYASASNMSIYPYWCNNITFKLNINMSNTIVMIIRPLMEKKPWTKYRIIEKI